jgi:hypothetical protein
MYEMNACNASVCPHISSLKLKQWILMKYDVGRVYREKCYGN